MDFARNEQIYSTRFMKSFFALNSSSLPVTYFYDLNDECHQDKSIWVKERCHKCLTGFLHCLKNEARLALILHDVAGIPYEEIARIFDKEEATVRQLISRSSRRVISFLSDNCVLYNPEGKCRCHLKKQVLEIDLPNEYEKLRASVQQLNVFTTMDRFLPPANFWEI
jgi:RNA polymerase sigma-70 factor (ECF subfamily)